MRKKIAILMQDQRYLSSIEKFLLTNIEDCECFAVTEASALAAQDIESFDTLIVSSLVGEGIWLKAMPIIRKFKSFILIALQNGPDLTEAVAKKYGASAFFKVPLNADQVLKAVNEVIEKAANDLSQFNPVTRDLMLGIEEAFETMDKKNYYEFLDLPVNAPIVDVKRNYLALARKYHPDKFRNVASAIKEKAYEITKRANEAYSVLANPSRKVIYDKMLRENPETKRFDFRIKVSFDANPEDTIQNQQARRFAIMAKKAMDSGDYKSALTQLKMAAAMEKNNSYLAELLDEVNKKLGN